MKTLYLLRHAKSSWSDKSLADQERPLKKRGLNDRQRVADAVTPDFKSPDHICSSSAVRTRETVPPFAAAWKVPEKKVSYHDDLYLVPVKSLLKFVKKTDDQVDTLMLVGHNPGMTDLFNFLAPKKKYVSHFPTCTFLSLDLPIDSWEELSEHCATSTDTYRPKDLDD